MFKVGPENPSATNGAESRIPKRLELLEPLERLEQLTC
jgi:hypothetical protein